MVSSLLLWKIINSWKVFKNLSFELNGKCKYSLLKKIPSNLWFVWVGNVVFKKFPTLVIPSLHLVIFFQIYGRDEKKTFCCQLLGGLVNLFSFWGVLNKSCMQMLQP
jgi:hypothetical protein